MQALILGGIFGGIAGVFLALKQASVVPSDYSTNLTFFAYTALLIGGAARVLGPVIGSIIFWFLIAGIGSFFSQAAGGEDALMPTWLMTDIQASLVRFILVGLGLMLLMIYRPQGIFGDRKEIAIDARGDSSTYEGSSRHDREQDLESAKPDPILVGNSITRAFGGLRAVDVEHIEIQRGIITALIGPTVPARPPCSTC